MTRSIVLLDLDGTLLDVRGRYAALHRDAMARCDAKPMGLHGYWRAKRQGRSEHDILTRSLGLDDATAARVIAFRDWKIESPGYLRRDRPWPWTRNCLSRLGALAELVLFTLRRGRSDLERQLDELKLSEHFTQVVAGEGFGGSKSELIAQAGIDLSRCRAHIGDTEVDIAAAKSLGVPSLAVGCGLRTASFLSLHHPDQLFTDLRGATRWLLTRLRPTAPGSRPRPRRA